MSEEECKGILDELKSLHHTQRVTQWLIVGFDALILVGVLVYVFLLPK